MTFMIHRDGAINMKNKKARKTFPVDVTRVNPVAWGMALHIAGRDVRRLQILDSNTVLVKN